MGITKKESRVMELSATLPAIRQTDIDWMADDYKKNYKNKGLSYYLILERCGDYQVIRYYYKTRKRLFEFMQIWLNKTDNIILAKKRHMRVDGWMEYSEMRPKRWFSIKHIEYSYLGGIERLGWSGAKVRTLIPELKQRGLKTSFHNIHPYHLCRTLLDSNRVETLFKLRQYLLAYIFAWHDKKLTDEVWQSIRVALRHGYHWSTREEAMDWIDMVNDLSFLGKDTRNPHYICPADLSESHSHWNEKARIKREEIALEKEKKRIEAYEPIFRANREQFFGMVFKYGKVTIQIIPTAMGIKEEGIHMHHCVGGYYDCPESLILSAKVDGKRVETIEVDLETYRLVQSRGLQNKSTGYHNNIVHLINANMDEIKRRNAGHKMITSISELKKAM